MADADSAAPMPMATFDDRVGRKSARPRSFATPATRAFVLRDGVWTDTSYRPRRMTTVDVPFASDEYFALLGEHPELGRAFALGQQVIVVVGDTAYRVTAERPEN